MKELLLTIPNDPLFLGVLAGFMFGALAGYTFFLIRQDRKKEKTALDYRPRRAGRALIKGYYEETYPYKRSVKLWNER